MIKNIYLNSINNKILLLVAFFFFISAVNSKANNFGLSEKNPVYVDKIEKKIYLYTKLNKDQSKNKNAHFGIVYEKGTMAKKAPFNTFINPITFHNKLVELGLKAGDNLNEDSTGVFVKGSTLKVYVLHEGKQYELTDILEDNTGKGFEIKFGGNKSTQEKMKTGCIMCLESCYAGITSNAKYPMISNIKRFISPNSYFRVKDIFLKPDAVFIFVFHGLN